MTTHLFSWQVACVIIDKLLTVLGKAPLNNQFYLFPMKFLQMRETSILSMDIAYDLRYSLKDKHLRKRNIS